MRRVIIINLFQPRFGRLSIVGRVLISFISAQHFRLVDRADVCNIWAKKFHSEDYRGIIFLFIVFFRSIILWSLAILQDTYRQM